MESNFTHVIVAVHIAYFQSLIVYKNTHHRSCYVYKKLKLQHSGVLGANPTESVAAL